jgi:hypothetical protein
MEKINYIRKFKVIAKILFGSIFLFLIIFSALFYRNYSKVEIKEYVKGSCIYEVNYFSDEFNDIELDGIVEAINYELNPFIELFSFILKKEDFEAINKEQVSVKSKILISLEREDLTYRLIFTVKDNSFKKHSFQIFKNGLQTRFPNNQIIVTIISKQSGKILKEFK